MHLFILYTYIYAIYMYTNFSIIITLFEYIVIFFLKKNESDGTFVGFDESNDSEINNIIIQRNNSNNEIGGNNGGNLGGNLGGNGNGNDNENNELTSDINMDNDNVKCTVFTQYFIS